jgi:alcohol dehydrogenase
MVSMSAQPAPICAVYPTRKGRVTCPINQARPSADTAVGFVALGSDHDEAFAEGCPLAEGDLHDVTSPPLSDAEIAVTPCAFGTAAGLLHRAGAGAGHAMLITGDPDGDGLAAVQLAARMGAPRPCRGTGSTSWWTWSPAMPGPG